MTTFFVWALAGALALAPLAAHAQSTRAEAQGGAGFGGTAQGGTQTTTFKNRVPGAIGVPGLAAGAPTCLGSVAAGGSFYGGGLGFGMTVLDRACESRMVADQLYRYGLKREAIAVLWNNHPLIQRSVRMGVLPARVTYRKAKR